MYPYRIIKTARSLNPYQINEINYDFVQKNQESLYNKLNTQLNSIKKIMEAIVSSIDYVYQYQYIQLEKDANNIKTLITQVEDNFKILKEYRYQILIYPYKYVITVPLLNQNEINNENYDQIQKVQEDIRNKLNTRLKSINEIISNLLRNENNNVCKLLHIQLVTDVNHTKIQIAQVNDNFKILEEHLSGNTEDNICSICCTYPNSVVLSCSIYHKICTNCEIELDRCPFCRALF